MSWWTRLKFTIAFTVYGFIFYVFLYYGLSSYNPELVRIPDRLDGDFVSIATGAFLLVIVLAYAGAHSIVRMPRAPRRPPRPRLRPESAPPPRARRRTRKRRPRIRDTQRPSRPGPKRPPRGPGRRPEPR
ncbi:MAG: hypothetical protein KDK35_11290 [Leptospiraceae bacterium]|nr:hypothetical protein [Leptospiraceae bacterium]